MKSFWIVFIGRILQMATAFVALRVMTELLGPSELGRFAIIISVTTFFALVFINPAGMYVNRRLHGWNASASLTRHLLRYALYVAAVSLFAAVTVPLFVNLSGVKWPIEIGWLTALVAGSTLVMTFNQTVVPTLNMLERRMAWLVFSTVSLWLALACSAFLVLREPRAESWQLGQLIGFAIGAIVTTPFLVKALNRTPTCTDESETPKRILAFAIPLALSVGLYWSQFQSYRLLIERYITLEMLGGFMGIYTLVAGLMTAFESLVQQYLYPKLYAESASTDDLARANAWKKYATLAIPMGVIAGLALYSAHGPFIRIFIAESFGEYSMFAGIAIFVETCRVIGSCYGMAGQVAYRTQALLLPQMIGVVLLVYLVPFCFGNSSYETSTAFTLALGIPALAYVFLATLVTRVNLGMKFPARMLNPSLIGLAIAWGLVSSSPLFSTDRTGDILHVIVSTIAFGALTAWVVRNWRRYEAPPGEDLRVVHIVRSPAGGIRLHVLALMDRPGTRQWVVTDPSAEDSIFANRRKDSTFAEKIIPLAIAEQPAPSDLINLARLYFQLRKIRPHVIHGHGAKGGLYARILADSLFARAAYSPHGGSLHSAFSPLKQTLFTMVEKILALKTDAAIFESDYSRTRYMKSITDLGFRGHLVPNGLPIVASRDGVRSRSGRFVIGTFGLLRHMKGQDILIRAVPLLKARDLDAHVRIHGDGPQLEEFRSLASDLRVEDRVEFVGDVADPLEKMKLCDLVVQPSRHESFGYTAVEAMMVGVPVVAFAVGGLKEIIENGKTGFLVEDLTPEALAEKILYVANHSEIAADVCRSARSKVETTYDARRMVESVFSIYRRTCSV